MIRFMRIITNKQYSQIYLFSLSHIRLRLIYAITRKRRVSVSAVFIQFLFPFCANALVVVVTVFDFHGIQKKGNK